MTDREFLGFILLAGVVTALAALAGWRLMNSPRRLHHKRMREKHSWNKSDSRRLDN